MSRTTIHQNSYRSGGLDRPAGFAVVDINIHTGCVSIGSSAFVHERTVVTREDGTLAPFPELDCPATTTYSRHTFPVKSCTDSGRQPDTSYNRRTQLPPHPCISYSADPGRSADFTYDSHPSRGRHPEILHTAFEFPEQCCVTTFVGGPFFPNGNTAFHFFQIVSSATEIRPFLRSFCNFGRACPVHRQMGRAAFFRNIPQSCPLPSYESPNPYERESILPSALRG